MKRQAHAGDSRRSDIVVSVAANERDAALLHEVRDIGVIPGVAIIRIPCAERRAALPAACVQQNHVARRDLYVLDLLERLEIFAVDRCAWLQPSLRTCFARQERGVEQHRTRENAVALRVYAAFRTSTSGLDV